MHNSTTLSARVHELRAAGWSYGTIARRLRVSRDLVWDIVKGRRGHAASE